MIDFEVYNQRRQQLIETFENNVDEFLETLKLTITDLVDIVDWEDSEDLAYFMWWNEDEDDE